MKTTNCFVKPANVTMGKTLSDCDVVIIGAGPYGLSAAAYLKAAGSEIRVFGEPMEFWEQQMPKGMLLRSFWKACHISDPNSALTLDAYCLSIGKQVCSPVPLDRFVDYGRWFQRQSVPNLDRRKVRTVDTDAHGFRVTLNDGETFTSTRVVIATGIGSFAWRPPEFDIIPRELASHSSEHRDLRRFVGQRVIVIGGGQSALESAALLHEAGADVEVIARQGHVNWVGGHSWLHHLGPISRALYSSRDVGPAGISRVVAVPPLLQRFPRKLQDRLSHRAIRPAGAHWLRTRLSAVPIVLNRKVTHATRAGDRLQLKLDDGSNRLVDHVLLATGFRVSVSRYPFLTGNLQSKLETVDGYPVLKPGLESSVPGLHFLGKPAAWSFGPLLCFVSGTEFAAKELVRSIAGNNGRRPNSDSHRPTRLYRVA